MQLLLISITACKRQPEANKGCVAQIIHLKPEDRKPHAECDIAISPPLVVHETAAKDKLLRLPITQDRNWNGEQCYMIISQTSACGSSTRVNACVLGANSRLNPKLKADN